MFEYSLDASTLVFTLVLFTLADSDESQAIDWRTYPVLPRARAISSGESTLRGREEAAWVRSNRRSDGRVWGLPDQPCYASLDPKKNAQKRCKACAAEAKKRRRYKRNRPKILAARKRKYWAKVGAEQEELQKYTDFRDFREFLTPGQEVPSLEEWRSMGLADEPNPFRKHGGTGS